MHMINRRLLALAAAALVAAACKEPTDIPDLNNVSDGTIATLNRSSVQLLVTGLLNQDRTNLDARYLIFSETMARDMYRIDAAENRFITELIGTNADPGGFVGGGVWTQFFTGIRAANTILDKLSTANDLSAAEQSATRGLVQTIKAVQFYRVLELRDTLGAPIDVDRPIGSDPAPFRCEPAVRAYISALLDSAYTNLLAGGSAFPFALPAGYSSNGAFNTPTAFANFFNRGWKGKNEVYRGLAGNSGSFATAITELTTAIAAGGGANAASLAKGVYFTYSTAPGETANPLPDAAIHLNMAVCDSIQSGDARSSKIVTGVAAASGSGVTTTCNASVSVPSSETLTRPIPELRVAELVLLRAQAEIGANQLAAATADVNLVRVNEGGLTALGTFGTARAAIDAVLYEKRYSLLFDSAQRLVDLRSYGRLNATFLKKETAQDIFQSSLPIPVSEINGRGGDATAVKCQA